MLNQKMVLILLGIVLIAGCAANQVDIILKATPVVNSFLEQYPNAKISTSLIEKEVIIAQLVDITKDCQNFPVSVYYKTVVEDVSKQTKIILWIDEKSLKVVCAVYEKNGEKAQVSPQSEKLPAPTTTTTLEITTTAPQATTTTTTTTLPPTTTTTLPLFNYTGGCLANSPVGDISLAQQLHSPDAATNYAKKEFSLNTSSINESYSILDNLCTEAVYSEVLTNYCEPNDGPAILQEIAWKPDGGLWWSGRCLKSDGNRSPDQISCVKKECHCKVKASPKLDLRPWDSPKIMVGDREHSLNLKDTYCSDGVCKALINVDGIPKNFTLLNRDVGGSPEITLLPLFINSETDFLSLKVAPACAAANLPDLVVPEVSDAVFDSTSKYYKFSFTVKNIGNATSESFNVTVSAKNDTEIFSLQPNSKSNIIFNIENYPGLGLSPGKTKNLSVITQFYDSYGMVVGSGRLKVDIEITGKNSEIMFESNRDNNKLLNKNITVIKK